MESGGFPGVFESRFWMGFLHRVDFDTTGGIEASDGRGARVIGLRRCRTPCPSRSHLRPTIQESVERLEATLFHHSQRWRRGDEHDQSLARLLLLAGGNKADNILGIVLNGWRQRSHQINRRFCQ